MLKEPAIRMAMIRGHGLERNRPSMVMLGREGVESWSHQSPSIQFEPAAMRGVMVTGRKPNRVSEPRITKNFSDT